MRPLGACGRADLVRAIAQGNQELVEFTAELLGFDAVPVTAVKSKPSGDSLKTEGLTESVRDTPKQDTPILPLADTPFWQVTAFEALAAAETVEQPVEPVEINWTNRPTEPPRIPLLAPWRELQVRLRRDAAQWHETRTLDVPAVVATLTRGRQIGRIPYERRRRWGPRLQIIADRSDRLVPYWLDQEVTGHALAKLLPAHQTEQAAIWEGLAAPRLLTDELGFGDYRLPPPGSLVLVLGDLGCLAEGDGELQRFWLGFGRWVADAGCHPVALLPCPLERCDKALGEIWRVLPWARSPGPVVTDPEQRRQRAERLLRLVSPALRIEPGFLRVVRLLLPAGEADSGTESDVWQHPALTSTSAAAATLAPDKAKEYRAAFASEPEALQRQVLAVLRIWRGELPKEIWFEEIQSLEAVSRALLPEEHKDKDLELTSRFFVQFSQRARGLAAGGIASGSLAWYRRCERRLTAAAFSDGEVGHALSRLSWTLHKDDEGFQPDPSFTPALVPPNRIRRLAVNQVAGQLQVLELADPARWTPVGSPLTTIESGNGLVKLGPVEETEIPLPSGEGRVRANEFWETGTPPPWASDWGLDEDGAWVEFSVQDTQGQRVGQKMRWMEPGSFQMGSPDTEAERFGDEGPQHEVHIQQGYWLFDTACTQALWQAVTGDNPSHFKGPDRPVERVSWDDAQGFIRQLNKLMPGLSLNLPSEAQWEYACRAGTATPFSHGDNITPEHVNYDGNNPYAGGAKGLYRQGTVPVKSLPANPWGLYEMHGNVLEWVQDAWHGSYNGAPTDGSAWESAETGAGRVLRGGSWYDFAWYCRSAYRSSRDPDGRSDSTGFRCARVQAGEPGGQAAGRPRQTRSGASQSALARPAVPVGASPRGDIPPFEKGGLGGVSRPDPRGGNSAEMAKSPPTPLSARSQAPAWERGLGSSGFTGQDKQELDGQGSQAGAWEPARLLRLDTTTTATAPLPQCQAFAILTDRERLLVRQTQKPKWAKSMGRDRFGLWADIAIENKQGGPVIQRLRWIPPGRFMMGSPDNEPGRWSDEGPQHPVTITNGYWLFDTPCTQALWEAVLPGEGPSRFPDPARPVESVSWDDIQQRFLPALNEHIPGFMLPNEAQWEYACRAGTDTALYTGPIEILGERNAPALNDIAWYGGNSGEGYELAEGYGSSDWKEVQYPNPKSGTREVGQKQPNPWGLYDMLGNVWEWCADGTRTYTEDAQIDPVGTTGAGRVLRGGSWNDLARYCRSACRNYYDPGIRLNYTGFRCARVQA